MLKVGDWVKVGGQTGEIRHKCQAFEGRWHVGYGAIPGTCCVREGECITVEPERVWKCATCGKWYWENEAHLCAHHNFFGPTPDPSWAQRAGMLAWEYGQAHHLILIGDPNNIEMSDELWGYTQEEADAEAERVGGRAILWDEGAD